MVFFAAEYGNGVLVRHVLLDASDESGTQDGSLISCLLLWLSESCAQDYIQILRLDIQIH